MVDWNAPEYEDYFDTFSHVPPQDVPWFTNDWWASPLNYLDGVRSKYPDRVTIQDVTLRDGEQTAGVVFNEDERVRIALALDDMGVSIIEVGMPAVHASVGRALSRLRREGVKAKLLAPAIAKREEVDRCAEVGADAIALGHPLNPYLCKHAYDIHSRQELVERLAEVINYATGQGMYVQLHGWDVFRNPLPYLLKLYEELVAVSSPDCITIMDTFGVVLPEAAELAVRSIAGVVGPDVELDVHTHNEYGLGISGALAAVAGGAVRIQSAMNGLGERTGNVPTEQAVAAFEILLGIDTGIDMSALGPVSRLVSEIAKVSVPHNQPIVGPGVFDLESGLPVRLMLKLESQGIKTGFSTYDPALVGMAERKITLGTGSGRANIRKYLEQLGVRATPDEEDRLVQLVKEESRVRKASVSTSDFNALARTVLNNSQPNPGTQRGSDI